MTSPRLTKRQWLLAAAATSATVVLGLSHTSSWAAGQNSPDAALPGKGITVLPVKSALAEENFQTLLVMKALQQLGYTVKPWEELDYPLIHLAVANGDATFMANHWNPHHSEFYKQAGGDAKLSRKGVYSAGAAQGYVIDKKTADAYKITRLDQLKDPKLAALFDMNGDGKADLIGPNAGWGGEAVVAHQINAFGLKNTVTYTQGNYPALIADTLSRFKAGKPVLYYAWTPYWLSNVLRPGHEVVWLQVPFSSMPGAARFNVSRHSTPPRQPAAWITCTRSARSPALRMSRACSMKRMPADTGPCFISKAFTRCAIPASPSSAT